MSRVKFTVLALLFLFPVYGYSGTGGDSDKFTSITTAFQYWLRSDPLIKTEYVVDSSLGSYYSLSAIALHLALKDPLSPWKIHAVANYNPWDGGQAIVGSADLQVNRDGTKESVMTDVYYFISKGEDESGPHLVVRPSREWAWDSAWEKVYAVDRFYIYYADVEASAAQEFDEFIQSYAIEKNPYRASVLELSEEANYQLKFLDNVSELNMSWDDLILEKNLKSLAMDLTQQYLERIPQYKAAGIGTKQGVLLAGPPGTGKSLLGQILISSIFHGSLRDKTSMIVVNARHLQYGSAVNILFTEAAKLGTTAIFMEDIDLFGIKNRDGSGSDNAHQEALLNELLNAIDGVRDNDGLLVVGTTNQLENVDSALLRSERIGMHLYFGLPSLEERMEFFERFGRKKAIWAEDLNTSWLAGRTEGMSGADIVEIIGLAKRFAYLEGSWSGESLFLTRDQFERAIAMVKNHPEGLKGEPRDYLKALKKLRAIDAQILR